jgi:peptidoglycan/xylan/chitin deacetylase (PgdA/CDA1 family)/predicted small lipoprotein YifL
MKGIVVIMRKHHKLLILVCIILLVSLTGCGKSSLIPDNNRQEDKNHTESQMPAGDKLESNSPSENSRVEGNDKETGNDTKQKNGNNSEADSGENSINDSPDIDISIVKPNEAGKIMVVMFHNFIESYKSGDKEWTTTFDNFRKLLETLYDKGYRLISMRDYLGNNISVPAGCIPMVFTFDDGTSGQFNLVQEEGRLVTNKKSAVGVMEEFNSIHPDFGLKGVFYVNLGLGTFQGEGTLSERLNHLIGLGFEIGNHTMSHVHLNEIKSAEVIQKEIGGNQKIMYELVPGYKMETFSLPYGLPAEELQKHVVSGEYEKTLYENTAVMEVGWDPAPSPVGKNFNPLSTPRVRAPGIVSVDGDLTWWLERLSREEQYVSDGSPDTVTVPESKKDAVDMDKLKGKKLVIY